jgi:hypothetical protein
MIESRTGFSNAQDTLSFPLPCPIGVTSGRAANVRSCAAAAAAEIGGSFAFWAWLRLDKSALWAVPGAVSLIVFALILTRIDAAFAGRASLALWCPRSARLGNPRRFRGLIVTTAYILNYYHDRMFGEGTTSA